MLPAIGSMMTAAIVAGFAANVALERVEIVVRHDDRVVRRALGHAGRAGDAERRDARAGGDEEGSRRGRDSRRRS